jgi:peroxiredoxin
MIRKNILLITIIMLAVFSTLSLAQRSVRMPGVPDEYVEMIKKSQSKDWKAVAALFDIALEQASLENMRKSMAGQSESLINGQHKRISSSIAMLAAEAFKTLDQKDKMFEALAVGYDMRQSSFVDVSSTKVEIPYAEALFEAGQANKALAVIENTALISRIEEAEAIHQKAYQLKNGSSDGYQAYAEKRLEEIAPIAVDFTVKDYQGNEVKLSDYQGKIIVLDFWYTKCAPCLQSMKKLKALYEEIHPQGVEFVLVEVYGDTEGALKIIKDNDYKYTFLEDDDRKANNLYGVTGYPSTFIIDRDFKIKIFHLGAPTAEVFAAEIEELLQKQ